jgi:hypothetical protein
MVPFTTAWTFPRLPVLVRLEYRWLATLRIPQCRSLVSAAGILASARSYLRTVLLILLTTLLIRRSCAHCAIGATLRIAGRRRYPGRSIDISKYMHQCLVILSIALAAVVCGCSNRVATYPVVGTVRFDDGEPVRIGVVEFRCADTGKTSRAKLDNTSSFALGTFTNRDGAPAGDYRVIVVQYFDAPPPKHLHTHDDAHDDFDTGSLTHAGHNHDREPDARVDRKFSDYSTTPMHTTVGPDSNNHFDFVVSHPTQPLRH